jgi:O-antigen/teichoic acid export membrane protein
LLTTAPIVIKILLTSEFLPIVNYIDWAILGILIQGIVWSLGVIVIAKGDLLLKLYTEIVGQVFLLAVNLLCYHFLGLKGLGMAVLISNAFSLVLIASVSFYRYNFRFSFGFLKLSIVLGIGCVIASGGSIYFGAPNAYLSGAFAFLLVGIFSYHQLNKRLNFKTGFVQLLKNFKRK